jgi:hypothetical protein
MRSLSENLVRLSPELTTTGLGLHTLPGGVAFKTNLLHLVRIPPLITEAVAWLCAVAYDEVSRGCTSSWLCVGDVPSQRLSQHNQWRKRRSRWCSTVNLQ